MNHDDLVNNLNELLQSDNGCQYTDLTDDVVDYSCLKSKYSLNVLHINIRSFAKNVDNLLLLLNDLQENGTVIHVIGVCETFLNKNSVALARIDNNNCIHKYRPSRLGGGVSILVHNSVRVVRELSTPFNENMESLAVELKYRNHPFLFAEIYRPPNTNDAEFKTNLDSLHETCREYKSCFVCGDFNYDLVKSESHAPTNNFLLTMLENCFVPTILKPTRVTYSSSTLIDNVFVKNKVIGRHSSYIVTMQCLITIHV